MASEIPGSGPVKFSDIEREFGRIPGIGTRKVGDYRSTFNFGELALPLADGVPTTGAVKFSDFRNKELQMVMDYYNDTHRSVNVKDDYDDGNNISTVGPGAIDPPINGGGKSIRIHVNNVVGCEQAAGNGTYKVCAMRTGDGWEAGTELNVDIGGNGLIVGAGGDGGRGGSPGDSGGYSGSPGNSALGVQWEDTKITVMNDSSPYRRLPVSSTGLGAIAGGGGGGGGGGGAKEKDRWNPTRRASGGGGGGGAGIPAGTGGLWGNTDHNRGGTGSNGIEPTAENIDTIANAAGGAETDEHEEAYSGHGGAGGAYQTLMSSDGGGVDNPSRMRGEGGETATGGDEKGAGGAYGYGGAAIRRSENTINWSFGTGHEGARVWGNGWLGKDTQDGGGVNGDPPLDNEDGVDTFN